MRCFCQFFGTLPRVSFWARKEVTTVRRSYEQVQDASSAEAMAFGLGLDGPFLSEELEPLGARCLPHLRSISWAFSMALPKG